MLESYSQEGVKTVSLVETDHWSEGWVARGGKEGLRLRQELEKEERAKKTI